LQRGNPLLAPRFTSAKTKKKVRFAWERTQDVRSLQLNIGVLDHFSPQRELRLDEVAQLFRGRGEAFETDILESRLYFRTVDDRAQGSVKFGDALRRSSRRRDQARPGIKVETFDAGFVHGRQVRKQRAALDARHRQRPQRAGTDMWHRGR